MPNHLRLLALTAAISATSCMILPEPKAPCSELCVEIGPAMRHGQGDYDEDVHAGRCAAIDDAPCSQCWADIGEMTDREYSVVIDCYCAADEALRDPEIEERLWPGGCSQLIEEVYEGEPDLLVASCDCSE